MKHYSITGRLFRTVLALLIPLLLLQGCVYIWSHAMVTGEVADSARSNLEYMRLYFKQRVADIYESAHLTMTDSHASEFLTRLMHDSFSGPSDYYMTMLEVQDDLAMLIYANDLIREASLLFPEQGIGVTTDSQMGLSIDDIPALYDALQEQNNVMLELDGRLYCVFGMPNTSGLTGAKILLCVEFDQEALEGFLTSYSAMGSKYSIMYHHARGYTLTSADCPLTAQEIDEAIFEDDAAEQICHRQVKIQGEQYVVFSSYSPLLQVTFAQLIPSWQYNQVPGTIGALILMLCGLTVLVLLRLLFVLRRTLTTPVSGMMTAFAAAGEGDFSVRLPEQEATEFNCLAEGYNAMIAHIDNLIDSNYRQTIRLQTAELKRLQAQINPHFLYNSFYYLRHLVADEEKESAEALCRYLGQYFQYITRSDQNTLPLEQEYRHAVTYLNIQLMRFGDTVEADVEPIPPQLSGIVVPRLIVEPVVENCFKYGLNATNDTGIIRIRFAELGDAADIIIENNGSDLSDEAIGQLQQSLALSPQEASFTGLVNTHHRLRLFFGEDAGVRVERSELGGLKVTLRVRRTAGKGGELPC